MLKSELFEEKCMYLQTLLTSFKMYIQLAGLRPEPLTLFPVGLRPIRVYHSFGVSATSR